MDTLRGQFGSFDDDTRDDDYGEDDISREAPPSPVGQDERRMQVRAYNHWASLLKDNNFPSIEDLDPEALPDFGPHSVLLDFTTGIESPAIQYLGETLGVECGTDDQIRTLDDVPSRSLLSRITDHYMQILANQAPIGFEAEFVNQRGATILYRGILLPFSSDDDTIDFIFGVINWKEMADQLTTDELLLEVDQALAETVPPSDDDGKENGEDDLAVAVVRTPDPVTDWADGPAADVPTGLAEIAEEPSGEEPVPEPGYAALAETSEEDPIEDNDKNLELSTEWAERGDVDWDDEDGESAVEFALPDIGDADEEDTIDHSAFASLSSASEDDVDGQGTNDESAGSMGLSGLRNKPAKKPLDLSLSSVVKPGAVDTAEDIEDDLPRPAFGQEDDRFATLMGADDYDDRSEDEVTDDWAAPLDLGLVAESIEDADEPADAPVAAPPVPVEPSAYEAPVGDAEKPVVEDSVVETNTAKPEEDAPTEIVLGPLLQDADEMGLHDILADARELAQLASTKEDRSRVALYDAVGRAYDVSLAAGEAPDDFADLIDENGLTMQDRAPMTPVVKLVFGAEYDKTRVTEYATVLTHAHRIGVERGELAGFLAKAEGGLKGIVRAERRLKRKEDGKSVEPANAVRSALAKKLRKLDGHSFDTIAPEGAEFGVVMIRRLENGEIVVLGEIGDDIPLVEKVARKLVG